MKEIEKSMSSHLGHFVPSHSKKTMSRFVNEIDRFHWNTVKNQDTDNLYTFMDHYQRSKGVCYGALLHNWQRWNP